MIDIRSFLDKHKYLDFFQLILRNIKNKNFIDDVLGLRNSKDPYCVQIVSFGEENPEDILFYIELKGRTGYCNTLKLTMEYLYYSAMMGFKPVIRWDNSSSPYGEADSFLGTNNVFEYFFDQPVGISVKSCLNSKKVVCAQKKYAGLIKAKANDTLMGYVASEEYLNEMSKIVHSYINLNQRIEKKIKEEMQEVITDGTLGIHIRGTDFRVGYNDHPIAVLSEEYFDEIDKLLESGRYNSIFLATDDSGLLNEFKDKYHGKIKYYNDVLRGDSDNFVDEIITNRDNNKFLLGYEILRDMITLANCKGLVAGVSQVSICTRIWNRGYCCKYIDEKIIDKGFYKSRITPKKHVKD